MQACVVTVNSGRWTRRFYAAKHPKETEGHKPLQPREADLVQLGFWGLQQSPVVLLVTSGCC